MKKIILSCVVASLVIPSVSFAQAPQIPNFPNAGQPINARAGACYAVTLRPATYSRAPMQVTQQDAYDQYAITPAEIGPDRVQTIVTRPAHNVYRVVDPQFEPYTETLTTRPAYEVLVAPRSDVRQVIDTYTVREPRLVWRRGANLSGVRRVDHATGEVYCLVEEAEVRTNATRTVRSNVGEVSRQSVPARVTQVTRYRQTRQGGYEVVPVAASTANVVYNDVRNPARVDVQRVPAVSTTIQVETIATDERYELVEVACEPGAMNMSSMGNGTGSVARSGVTTPGHMVSLRSVQGALRAKGLYRGPIDGILGSDTHAALRQFQRQNGISSREVLSIETLRRLGL